MRRLEGLTGGGGSGEGGDAIPGPGAVSSLAGRHNTAPTPTSATLAPLPVEGGSSSSHPQGWFHGKFPSFGTCGGKRGSLTMIWEIWGGEGPGKVTGGVSGWNLRQHGDTSVKEQEVWGSTSNYGRYLQAGRYMDNKIASIKVSTRGP